MNYHHLFGPVLSRRLGISLGVDLVAHKICSLDCIYCECGKTTDLTLDQTQVAPFARVKAELDHYWQHHPDPDYITFSGSGEPTLNPCLGKVIAYIKQSKPNIRVAVLTNSTLMHRPDVRQALLKADRVVPSLDAVTKKAFEAINRPHPELDLDRMIHGLADFSKFYTGELFLEVFILPGINDSPGDIRTLNTIVAQIKPDRIQLNTLDRPGTLSHLHPAERNHLEQIKDMLDAAPVEIIAKADNTRQSKIQREDMRQAILETIHRRPCTKKDLAQTLGLEQAAIDQYITELEDQAVIKAVPQERGLFYHTIKETDK